MSSDAIESYRRELRWGSDRVRTPPPPRWRWWDVCMVIALIGGSAILALALR